MEVLITKAKLIRDSLNALSFPIPSRATHTRYTCTISSLTHPSYIRYITYISFFILKFKGRTLAFTLG